MFTLNRKRAAIHALIRARREYDTAMIAFLKAFREDKASLEAEIEKLTASEAAEFVLGACEMNVLTIFPCRVRSEFSEFLMGPCEGALSEAISRIASTDVLGVIAAHDSLPESMKAAARNRIPRVKRPPEPGGSAPEEEEDYGRGRYCVGCGGC